MSIAGLVLACMLEVECVEGRNPMRFLESLITSLECDDTPTVTGPNNLIHSTALLLLTGIIHALTSLFTSRHDPHHRYVNRVDTSR